MSMRRKNIWLFLLIDSIVISLSLLGAYLLRYDFIIPKEVFSNASYFLIVLLFSKLSANVVFNVYSGLWKYTSITDLLNIVKAIGTASDTINAEYSNGMPFKLQCKLGDSGGFMNFYLAPRVDDR